MECDVRVTIHELTSLFPDCPCRCRSRRAWTAPGAVFLVPECRCASDCGISPGIFSVCARDPSTPRCQLSLAMISINKGITRAKSLRWLTIRAITYCIRSLPWWRWSINFSASPPRWLLQAEGERSLLLFAFSFISFILLRPLVIAAA